MESAMFKLLILLLLCLIGGVKMFRFSSLSKAFKCIPLRASQDNSPTADISRATPASSEDTITKGFGKAKPKAAPAKSAAAEPVKDIGSLTYEKQAKRGVPEYNIFLRPSNGSESEWVPVGSMTIPRDVSIAKAVFDVEEELLKGTFKIYPQLKKFYDDKKQARLGDYERESVFEYGYCLKAFPDEQIQLIRKEKQKQNPLTDWLSKITNPIDTSEVRQQRPTLNRKL